MAMQMIIVPEEFYNSLVQQRQGVFENPMETHFLSAKDDINKILNNPHLTEAQKSALYNSLFKRLQNIKGESVEKAPPLNVNVKNFPDTPEPEPSVTSDTGSSRSRRRSTSSSDTDIPYRSATESPGARRAESSASNGEISSTSSRSERSTPRPKRNASKKDKENAAKEEAKAVEKYLMEHRRELGINDKGEILGKNNKPIKKSNVKMAAYRFVQNPSSPAPSPPGMKVLRTRLGEENKDFLTNITTNLWGRGMSQTMIDPSIKMQRNPRKIIFKPQLWPMLSRP